MLNPALTLVELSRPGSVCTSTHRLHNLTHVSSNWPHGGLCQLYIARPELYVNPHACHSGLKVEPGRAGGHGL